MKLKFQNRLGEPSSGCENIFKTFFAFDMFPYNVIYDLNMLQEIVNMIVNNLIKQ